MADYALIPLGKKARGGYTKVDFEMFNFLNQWRWRLDDKGYARRTGGADRKDVFLHRVVNNTPEGSMTDHINGDPLDNRSANLRSCTSSQNNINKNYVLSASGLRGVTWHKRDQVWQAKIQVDGKQHYLGNFLNPNDAAKAYDKKAVELHKDFAKFNFGLA
jgi:hypothetical protein